LVDLCGDEFSCLKVYFTDEALDSVVHLNLDEEDLIMLAEPQARMKMLKFWRARVQLLLPGKPSPNWTAIRAIRLPSMTTSP
jgi:hypothetical protein